MRNVPRTSLIALALLAGCDSPRSGQSPPATDEDRVQLRAALNVWKEGKVASLATQAPPIRLVDSDQAAGCVLVSFEIKPPPPGVNPPGILVTLKLRDPKGRKVERHASYRVETSNEIVIRRSES